MHPACRMLLEGLSRPVSLANRSLSEWDGLLRAAHMTKTLGRLAALAEREQVLQQIPEQVRRHLEGALVLIGASQRHVRRELERMARVVRGLEVQPILLKAAAYIASGLPAAVGRNAGDFDLLVPRGDLDQVWERLLASGWECRDYSEDDRRYFREWLHEFPPLRHKYWGGMIDLHHNILPFTDPVKFQVEPLIRASVPITNYPAFRMLAPPDMFLHGAVHLFRNGDYSKAVRDLSDLDLLTREFIRDEHFFETLFARAEELRLVPTAKIALDCLHRYFGLPFPASAESRLAISSMRSMWHRAILRLIDAAIIPRTIARQELRLRYSRRLLSYLPPPRARVALSPLFWKKRFARPESAG